MAIIENFIEIEGRAMKPTLTHRPGIWECMLGTVYAMNDNYDVKYFDYDYDAARKWAGIDEEDRDPRIFKNTRHHARYSDDSTQDPRKNQRVLWIKRKPIFRKEN